MNNMAAVQKLNERELELGITPEASFASDLGADSLDVVEMVMKIEEEFNGELPDERAEEVQHLSDALRVVTELTA